MFRYIITITGLLLAACAAYFSVTGLSQLFVGGGIIITIMASILEASKILSVSILERYWDRLSKLLKGYLITAIVVLMLITSAGIYGLLANGYQKTFTELDKQEYLIKDINQKQDILKENLTNLEKDKGALYEEKQQLNKQRSGQQIQYTNSNGDLVTTTRDLSSAEKSINLKRLKSIDEQLNRLDNKITTIRDSSSTLQYKLMDSKMNDDISGEIGPLIYLSNLTGKSMDSIVNYLILLIIFIFDPLAVTLIFVANKLRITPKKDTIINDDPPTKIEPTIKEDNVDGEVKEKEVPKEKKVNNKKAKDIIEKAKNNNNRNFSVKIPYRDEKNTIKRI